MEHVIGLALEWFGGSGPRERERLDDLVRHFATQYNLTEETIERLQVEAWDRHQKNRERERNTRRPEEE